MTPSRYQVLNDGVAVAFDRTVFGKLVNSADRPEELLTRLPDEVLS
jgi:hypothetical protein